MNIEFLYRGRQVSQQNITFIKGLIRSNVGISRWALSRELCRQWNWTQKNGALKDMACRGLLLKLESEGFLILPPRKRITNNPFLNRKSPEPIEIDQTPIICNIKDILPIQLKSVRKTKFEKLYNSLIQEHHYLGYSQPVGENFKYMAFFKNRPIACIGWTSPAWHLESRDKFIGWTPENRKKNLHFVAYQTRFLIVPWAKVSCLASHLLGLNARIISENWLNFYKHRIHFLETFVDTEGMGFKGTCYKAANWIYLGKTTGRGMFDQTHKQNRSKKSVYGYPLNKNFRKILNS